VIALEQIAPTRYATFSPWAARSVLLLIALLVLLPAIPHAQLKIPGERQHWWEKAVGYTDNDLYRDILTQMERGANYYDAAASEQRAHHYPTRPAPAFREPTLAWILSVLRFQALQLMALYGIYAAILLRLYRGVVDAGKPFIIRIATISAAVTGLSIVGMPDGLYLHEVWAAMLIAASLLFYRADRWWPAIVLGLLACLIRELAVPYVFVMIAFALYERRWRELLGWVSSLAVFALFYAWHISQAMREFRPGDLSSQGWIGMGGWNFAIATAKWNILLSMLPSPLVALAICVGIVGLAGAYDSRARRAACVVAGYLLAFLIVGRLDNYYWGILFTPLLPLGFVFAPGSLRDLFNRAFVRMPLPAH
jgi:hypothetical protein